MTSDLVQSANSPSGGRVLRGWRSVMFAPVGSGQRRRRGSDGVRLAAAVLGLGCCLLVIRFDSRVDRRLFTSYLPPIWGWLTLVWMRKREYL